MQEACSHCCFCKQVKLDTELMFLYVIYADLLLTSSKWTQQVIIEITVGAVEAGTDGVRTKEKTKRPVQSRRIFTPSYLLCSHVLPAVSVLLFASVWTACVEECVWVWVDSSSADAT